jgi:hypothetical protein
MTPAEPVGTGTGTTAGAGTGLGAGDELAAGWLLALLPPAPPPQAAKAMAVLSKTAASLRLLRLWLMLTVLRFSRFAAARLFLARGVPIKIFIETGSFKTKSNFPGRAAFHN